MTAFAAQHVQADFGARAPTGSFTTAALDDTTKRAERPVLNDIHGLMTYVSEPRPILMKVGPVTGIRGANGPRLFATLLRARDINASMSDAEQLAYDLFSAAAVEGAADARFMMLMMALETLIQQQACSPETLAHIEKLRKMTADSKLPDYERQSLDSALQSLTQESVGRAGRRLARTLGDRRYLTEKPIQFFNECYEVRSALAHGHLDRPSRDAVSARAGTLELFVADLLAGTLVGSEQAKRSGRSGVQEGDQVPPAPGPLWAVRERAGSGSDR